MPKAKDYETNDEDDNECFDKGDDFPSMFNDLFRKLPLKVAFFLFILGVFIFSDVFIENVLMPFGEDNVDINCPTTKGTVTQLLFLCTGYMILDLLVKGDFL